MADDVKEGVRWDPKEGFTLPYKTPYDYYFILKCSTTVNGREYSSNYLVERTSKCLGYYFLKTQRLKLDL